MNNEMDLADLVFKTINCFDIKLHEYSDRYVGSCPVHCGDNPTGFRLFKHGLAWRCYSHNCHEVFGKNIIGLVRGLLSRERYNWSQHSDKQISWNETYTFLNKEFKYISSTSSKEISINLDIQQYHEYEIPRNKIRETLVFPCQFYLDRGINKEILDKYDVGICLNPRKKMFYRAIVPIYDESYKFSIGCLGRSLYPKCAKCNLYHSNRIACPSPGPYFIKWRNSKFDRNNTLYNCWFAKNYILKSHSAILCEGPGDVWKLEQCGIHNSLAICGTELTDNQLLRLGRLKIKKLVLCLDNDDPGILATKNIVEKCKRLFHIEIPKVCGNNKDIGDTEDYIIKERLAEYVSN